MSETDKSTETPQFEEKFDSSQIDSFEFSVNSDEDDIDESFELKTNIPLISDEKQRLLESIDSEEAKAIQIFQNLKKYEKCGYIFAISYITCFTMFWPIPLASAFFTQRILFARPLNLLVHVADMTNRAGIYFSTLQTARFAQTTYEISKDPHNMFISASLAGLVFLPYRSPWMQRIRLASISACTLTALNYFFPLSPPDDGLTFESVKK